MVPGTTIFDTDTLKADSGLVISKGFVVKYNSSGTIQWVQGIGGGGVESVLALSSGAGRINKNLGKI